MINNQSKVLLMSSWSRPGNPEIIFIANMIQSMQVIQLTKRIYENSYWNSNKHH